MSNTMEDFLPQLPQIPQVTITPENDEKFPCPQCDRVFDRQQQLTGHLASHAGSSDRKPCPECGKAYRGGVGLASHRARVHGVQGTSKSSTARYVREAKPDKTLATVAKISPALGADDILTATLTLLYPSGKIPLQDVVPVMRWRDATEEMLRGIHGK